MINTPHSEFDKGAAMTRSASTGGIRSFRHLWGVLLAAVLFTGAIWIWLPAGLGTLALLVILAAGRYLLERRSRLKAQHEALEKQVQERTAALRESKERFELAVSGSNDGIWDWDLRNHRLFLSPKWKEQLGFRDEELPNEFASFENRLHPDDRPFVLKQVERYLQGKTGVYDIDFRLRHKDGAFRWIHARGEAIRDDKGIPYRMAGSHTDITERKQAEAQLTQQLSKINTILASIQAGVILVRKQDRVIVDANPAAADMIGVPRDVLIGKVCNDFICPAEAGRCPVFDLGQTLENTERMIKTPEGELIPVLKNVSLVELDGETFLLESFVDIRRQKQAETDLLETNRQLEEATARANRMALEAEMASIAKSEFLANMSHEIRTPMNAIVGFSYLLTDPDSSEESKAEYYNIIKSNGEVLMNLINDILDISMIESGQLKTRNKAANIGNIVRELLTHYNQTKDELEKKKLTITLDIEETDSSLTVKTDPVRLRQVLSNLLSNSLKFTNEGRISFGYRLSDSKEIIFFVRDTGCGIDPKNHRAIFERFNKFGNASDAKLYTGSGLGLAISHELVNLLGGKIWLDSFPGKGSTFYFTIPYIPEKVREVPDDHLDQNTFYERITNKTILVAEDVLSNFQLIQAFLSSAKVNILWAQNGVEAIDIFTKNRNIDIILMDVQMPIMDGLKALKRIRELDKKVPIIVNSAFYMPDEMEKSFTAGCSDYMTKPIKKEDLISKLSGFLS